MNNRNQNEENELKYLKSIDNNLKFFFWLTVCSFVGAVLGALYIIQNAQ
jgi:hypothetical protein